MAPITVNIILIAKVSKACTSEGANLKFASDPNSHSSLPVIPVVVTVLGGGDD